MIKIVKRLGVATGLLIVLLFYFWTSLIAVSFFLLFLIDFFTLGIVLNFFKKKLPKDGVTVFRYITIISLPIFIAVFIRTFFFDFYYVPSSSMERTLAPGDYVVVNKISYGVKVPLHLRNVPVIGGYFNPPNNEYKLFKKLRKFESLNRNDIVVFKAVVNEDKYLIKRIVGLPGDTISLRDSYVFINSDKISEPDNLVHNYGREILNGSVIYENYSNKEFSLLTEENKSKLTRHGLDIKDPNYPIFPFSKQKLWTKDNYGPLLIPRKDLTITLNEQNYDDYKRIIYRFEGEKVALKQGEEKSYTFKNDYYFLLGDNRNHSLDSRSFGFVPEDYIQGKMISKF